MAEAKERLGIGDISREQEILDLWNARLNPPGSPSKIGDVQWTVDELNTRNEYVELLRNARDLNLQSEIERQLESIAFIDGDANFTLFDLDPETIYDSDEVTEIQNEKSDTSLILKEPVTMNDVFSLNEEISRDVLKEWESQGYVGTIAEAQTFVSENLF